jgi:hypothetical protein
MAVDDLLGPAYEGLCKGAVGFDPALGARCQLGRRLASIT